MFPKGSPLSCVPRMINLFIRRQQHVWSNHLPPALPPAVRAHAGGNHDIRIFETLPEGQLVDETHPPTPRPPCKKAVPSYKGLAGLQVRGGWFNLWPCRASLFLHACRQQLLRKLCEGLRYSELPVLPEDADDCPGNTRANPLACCLPSHPSHLSQSYSCVAVKSHRLRKSLGARVGPKYRSLEGRRPNQEQSTETHALTKACLKSRSKWSGCC